MIVTWGHDPILSSHTSLLITLNEVSCHGPILVHCYAETESHQVSFKRSIKYICPYMYAYLSLFMDKYEQLMI